MLFGKVMISLDQLLHLLSQLLWATVCEAQLLQPTKPIPAAFYTYHGLLLKSVNTWLKNCQNLIKETSLVGLMDSFVYT